MSVGCKTAWISDVCVCVGCVFLVQEPYNLSETVLYAGPFSFFVTINSKHCLLKKNTLFWNYCMEDGNAIRKI